MVREGRNKEDDANDNNEDDNDIRKTQYGRSAEKLNLQHRPRNREAKNRSNNHASNK